MKEPSFDRIINATEEERDAVNEERKALAQQSGEEMFGKYIIEANEHEKAEILRAVDYANDIAKRYGSSRTVDLERVFLLEHGGVEEVTEGRIITAFANNFKGIIGVERHFSDSILAASVVHECFHLTSYHSYQIDQGEYVIPYRDGISMNGRSGEGRYFEMVNEAVVTTLTKRFFDEVISKDEKYRADIERTNKIKEWLIAFIERDDRDQEWKNKYLQIVKDILILPDTEEIYKLFYETDEPDGSKIAYFEGYYKEELEDGDIFLERANERVEFDKVLDEIMDKSDGKIKDKNALFDEFARAHFTGNYLPLARLVEGILGKGSFREIGIRLGEMQSDDNEGDQVSHRK